MSNENATPVRQMTPIQEADAPLPGSLESEDSEPDVTMQYGVTLYKAALNGDWGTVDRIWKNSPGWIYTSITKGGETVLHIAAAAKHIYLVGQLVYFMEPDHLSLLRNKVGSTALCFAAVSGVVEIARVMVEKNKALPNIKGSHGMTPLHMAVLLGHRHMVEYLLEVTDIEQLSDQERVGLLTGAIETDLLEVALKILHENPKLAVLRDGKEETALHALARKPLKSAYKSCMWKSFKMPCTRMAKANNKEPRAALELAQNLWNVIIKEKPEDISKLIGHPWRLLFVAAQLGKVKFLTVLIKSYPDVMWKVDENRYSIFHIAVIHRHDKILKLMYEIGAIKDLIATYKDDCRNNMLHLAAKLAPPSRLECVSGAALQMQREILWFEAVKKIVRPEYTEAENEDHETPQGLFSEEHEQLRIKGEVWMKKTAESCALVAILIATMVFGAAFQLPGGFNNNTGSPVLVKRASFVIFAMSNGVSLFTSTASLLMFLSILTSRYAERDFLISLPLKLMSGLILLFISIATMMVAFTAAFFITFQLQEGMSWAPILVACIASIPVTLFIFQQLPLLTDIYLSTYKSKSMFQPSKPKLFRIPSQHNIAARADEAKTWYPKFCFTYLHPDVSVAPTYRQTLSRIVDPFPTLVMPAQPASTQEFAETC